MRPVMGHGLVRRLALQLPLRRAISVQHFVNMTKCINSSWSRRVNKPSHIARDRMPL